MRVADQAEGSCTYVQFSHIRVGESRATASVRHGDQGYTRIKPAAPFDQ
jgi:hypothetical protein